MNPVNDSGMVAKVEEAIARKAGVYIDGFKSPLWCENAARAAIEAAGLNELRSVVQKCADKFREYERMHLAKKQPLPGPIDVFFENAVIANNEDAERKAARNREMAELCEAALSRSEGDVAP